MRPDWQRLSISKNDSVCRSSDSARSIGFLGSFFFPLGLPISSNSPSSSPSASPSGCFSFFLSGVNYVWQWVLMHSLKNIFKPDSFHNHRPCCRWLTTQSRRTLKVFIFNNTARPRQLRSNNTLAPPPPPGLLGAIYYGHRLPPLNISPNFLYQIAQPWHF